MVDKTDGTIAVSNGGTTVTGTSTSFAASDKRSFIQPQNDTNWYEVTVVAGQVLTISPPFAGATLTTGTYTLRKVFYTLPTALTSIVDIRQTVTPVKLTALGILTLDLYQPNINNVGAPAGYYLFRIDPDIALTASKAQQIALFPSPDAVYNLELRYIADTPDLAADTDISYLPVAYHTVMVDGAEWLGSKFLNTDNQDQLKKAYEYSIEKTLEKEDAHGDWMPVLGSTDTQTASRFLPFPTTFEQPR